MDESEKKDRPDIDTGSGASTGPDKTVHGDDIHGNIHVGGGVSGTGIAIGHKAQAEVHAGISGDELARLFQAIYQQIEARPPDPNVDKVEIKEQVAKIEQEVAKEEEANPNKVERWLKNLITMAPDIFEVTVACLTSPAAGVAAVIRKVAQKAREEAALS